MGNESDNTPKVRERLLDELHQEQTGIVRMKAVARSYFWYAKLDADIEKLSHSCEACLRMRNDPPKVPFVPWSNARKPWERVHVYLVLVDTYGACHPRNESSVAKILFLFLSII